MSIYQCIYLSNEKGLPPMTTTTWSVSRERYQHFPHHESLRDVDICMRSIQLCALIHYDEREPGQCSVYSCNVRLRRPLLQWLTDGYVFLCRNPSLLWTRSEGIAVLSPSPCLNEAGLRGLKPRCCCLSGGRLYIRSSYCLLLTMPCSLSPSRRRFLIIPPYAGPYIHSWGGLFSRECPASDQAGLGKVPGGRQHVWWA